MSEVSLKRSTGPERSTLNQDRYALGIDTPRTESRTKSDIDSIWLQPIESAVPSLMAGRELLQSMAFWPLVSRTYPDFWQIRKWQAGAEARKTPEI